ncbi:hypothetical protein [Streptomyces sp. NPDC048057]|uniref:hypothetical protein n=1 Tax=Streptomyces sp. NPDC048057 TaxID=3155628 RepID=UPI0033EBCD82
MTSPQRPAPETPVVADDPEAPEATEVLDVSATPGTADAPAAPDASAAPFASSSAAPARLMAGLGMLFLLGSLVLCAAITLTYAYEGDGVAGPIAAAAYWGLLIGGLTGAVALFSPVGTMTNTVRAWIVAVQYALVCAAPVLVVIDG